MEEERQQPRRSVRAGNRRGAAEPAEQTEGEGAVVVRDGLRNGRAPPLVLLAEVIYSLRLRSAGAEKAELSCQAASAVSAAFSAARTELLVPAPPALGIFCALLRRI